MARLQRGVSPHAAEAVRLRRRPRTTPHPHSHHTISLRDPSQDPYTHLPPPCLIAAPPVISMDATGANLSRDVPVVAPPPPPQQSGGQATPPSPFTDSSSSSAPALSAVFASAATSAHTDLTSLPSDMSKLSLGLGSPDYKKQSFLAEEPPAVAWPYAHAAALDDVPGIAYALDTFLKSQMVEAEEYCHRNDPKKCVCPPSPSVPVQPPSLPGFYSLLPRRERLYFATGFGLIQCVKALMSYEDDVRVFARDVH